MHRLKSTIVRCLFWVLATPLVAHSTTVVVKMENRRIILAADTRRDTKTLGQAAPNYHDDYCKIVGLGNVGFAASGNSDYHRTQAGDSVPDWSAWDEAETSYASHKDSLVDMAESWGSSTITHYQIFYSVNPSRVKELAAVNPENVLIEGLFAGWDTKGLPILVTVVIKLGSLAISPVVGTKYVLPQRDLPYTSNQHTKDLIEEDATKMKAVAKKWKKTSKHFRKSEQDWRWVEFVVQSTSDYDETVGKKVDVLEILPFSSHWLHKSSCPAY
jgi:hypothetical protein